MSRVPPFPAARRPQTPSANEYDYGPPSPKTTRPLQINRPPTRPTTPSNKTTGISSSPSGSGPSRPQRSGLRSRHVSEYSTSDRLSIDSGSGDYRERRDSAATTRSDISQPPPRPARSNVPASAGGSNGRLKPPPARSPTSPDEVPSPLAANAIAAFQALMSKKTRGKTDDDYIDEEYERAKRKELAIQKDYQRRLQERVPGRKATKPRAGDIDGKQYLCINHQETQSLSVKLSSMRLRMSGRLRPTLMM